MAERFRTSPQESLSLRKLACESESSRAPTDSRPLRTEQNSNLPSQLCGQQITAALVSRTRATAQAARGGRSSRRDRRSGRRNSSAKQCFTKPVSSTTRSPIVNQHDWSSTGTFIGSGVGASGVPFEQFKPRHGDVGRGASSGWRGVEPLGR